jgi:serine/threonine-protein kinase
MGLEKIGRYEIRGELGRGAMGVVYRGYDPNIGREVALKTIHLDLQDTEAVERFRREAKTAGILSHPNIVTIYDAGDDNGLFYIAMELIVGETLQEVMARGRMPVEQVLSVVRQVAAALEYAHGRNVIHRDIKPANIMLADGQAKVTDFGLAKVTSSMASATKVVGTPSYMSPEQIMSGVLDGRSDIFSLGAMTYEMLTGMRPFQGENIPVVMFKVMKEEPAPPAVVNPAIHRGLNYIVVKALAKDPSRRYQSCKELIAHLRDYESLGGMEAPATGGMPSEKIPSLVSASLPVTPTDPRQTVRAAPTLPAMREVRGQWKAVGVGVAGLALLMVGALSYWQFTSGNAPESAVPSEQPAAPAPATPGAGPGGTQPATPPPVAQPPAAAQPAPRPSPAAGTPAPETTTTEEPPASPSPRPASRPRFVPPPASAVIGRISVHTQPQGARIFVNDAETPYRTPVNFSLTPGTYRVTVERNGYEQATQEIEVRQGQTASVQLELQPSGERRSLLPFR